MSHKPSRVAKNYNCLTNSSCQPPWFDQILISYADNVSASEFVAITSCVVGLSLPEGDMASIQLFSSIVAVLRFGKLFQNIQHMQRIYQNTQQACVFDEISTVDGNGITGNA
jgi:hypothetical protein